MNESNPFRLLYETFSDKRVDEIGKLFDESSDLSADKDQVILNGLALLLNCLENAADDPDVIGTSLGCPFLCKIQALQAAYHIGFLAGKNMISN